MKKKTFTLSVPEPCHENWNKMTPADKGRFCKSCEKTVIDFTNQSDRAIAETFKKAEGQICGRFTPNQLDRPIPLEPKLYQNTRWKAFGLMLSSLLATSDIKATDFKTITPPPTHQAFLPPIEDATSDILAEVITLEGRLIDQENNEALIAVSVSVLMPNGKKINSLTDINGHFELKIPTDLLKIEGEEEASIDIKFEYVAYETLTKTFSFGELNGKKSIDLGAVALKVDTKIAIVESLSIEKKSFTVGMVMSLPHQEEAKNEITLTGTLINDLDFLTGEVYTIQREDNTLYKLIKNKLNKRKTEKSVCEAPKTEKPRLAIPDNPAIEKPAERQIPTAEMPTLPTKLIQKAYPNPFNSELTVEIKTTEATKYDLVIFDGLGQEVYRERVMAAAGDNVFVLQPKAANFAAGTYFLSVLNKEEVLQTEMIIKN